ncbi:protein of unknown function (plasmid) [Azospirillum baldaniorum]|uniref:Uncharacterized protein n=1 Tax=Azospirillum baldaniorum TaxID=1064539 RepID=A0A9P1K0P4_9PROT|nr:protein of unknown function [Azospirillum baldaniorum]
MAKRARGVRRSHAHMGLDRTIEPTFEPKFEPKFQGSIFPREEFTHVCPDPTEARRRDRRGLPRADRRLPGRRLRSAGGQRGRHQRHQRRP